ncbi:MAG TPA: hypothetical protein VMM18_04315 [Gemmatimonadaceae bacterium]|nr:hypothetical protein [Gemmatimonadaceae bacterium]
MRSRILTGAVAGIAAGVPFGLMMQMMSAPTPDGGSMPMMAMVAMVVGSQSLVVGWLYHLVNSALIGALFGFMLGSRVDATASGLGLGAAWGVGWWVLGALILMPLMLGMPAFAALRMPPMRPVALGSLAGHLLYGVILGWMYVRLRGTSSAGAREHSARMKRDQVVTP